MILWLCNRPVFYISVYFNAERGREVVERGASHTFCLVVVNQPQSVSPFTQGRRENATRAAAAVSRLAWRRVLLNGNIYWTERRVAALPVVGQWPGVVMMAEGVIVVVAEAAGKGDSQSHTAQGTEESERGTNNAVEEGKLAWVWIVPVSALDAVPVWNRRVVGRSYLLDFYRRLFLYFCWEAATMNNGEKTSRCRSWLILHTCASYLNQKRGNWCGLLLVTIN